MKYDPTSGNDENLLFDPATGQYEDKFEIMLRSIVRRLKEEDYSARLNVRNLAEDFMITIPDPKPVSLSEFLCQLFISIRDEFDCMVTCEENGFVVMLDSANAFKIDVSKCEVITCGLH
jgi:hypothetical protein